MKQLLGVRQHLKQALRSTDSLREFLPPPGNAMRQLLLISAMWLLWPSAVFAEAAGPGSYFVTAPTLNVRLAPDGSAKITNRLYRQNRVDVVELRNGWARISRYYDGRIEGLSGQVARWVAATHLAKQKPSDVAQPNVPRDSRISGIPEVGSGGLTEYDVIILHRGAKHMISLGRCARVVYGDKSTSKPNTYFVTCSNARNQFFSPSELAGG